MANSFTFNSVDMASYGLVRSLHTKPFAQITDASQLRDRAYAFDSKRPQTLMELEVWITAADKATLLGYLDSIKTALNSRGNKVLSLDIYTDRYWMARFDSMEGSFRGSVAWEGTIMFILYDPAAYDNTETSTPYAGITDPDTQTETVGGTERTKPVFVLTCNAALPATTVSIFNAATGETITWTGDLVNGSVLTIDCEDCLVKLNGTEDMVSVDGQFPRLLVGDNELTIEGFTGDMDVNYSKRYV